MLIFLDSLLNQIPFYDTEMDRKDLKYIKIKVKIIKKHVKFINFLGKDFYDYNYIDNQFVENNGKTEQLNRILKHWNEQNT